MHATDERVWCPPTIIAVDTISSPPNTVILQIPATAKAQADGESKAACNRRASATVKTRRRNKTSPLSEAFPNSVQLCTVSARALMWNLGFSFIQTESIPSVPSPPRALRPAGHSG